MQSLHTATDRRPLESGLVEMSKCGDEKEKVSDGGNAMIASNRKRKPLLQASTFEQASPLKWLLSFHNDQLLKRTVKWTSLVTNF